MKCSVARCSTVQDTGSGSSPSRRRPGLPSGFSLRVQYLPFPRASPVLLSGLSVLSPCFSVSLFSDAQVVLIACFAFSPFFGRLPPPGSVACLQFLPFSFAPFPLQIFQSNLFIHNSRQNSRSVKIRVTSSLFVILFGEFIRVLFRQLPNLKKKKNKFPDVDVALRHGTSFLATQNREFVNTRRILPKTLINTPGPPVGGILFDHDVQP